MDLGMWSVLAIILLALALYGSGVGRGGDRAAYDEALLALTATDAALDRDLHRLQSNALNHYDSVVFATRQMRRIENRLSREPSGLEAGPFADARVETSVLLGQKLSLVEEFKTAHAAWRASLSALPAFVDAWQGSAAPGGPGMAPFLTAMQAYMLSPDAAREALLREQLAGLDAAGADSLDRLSGQMERAVSARAELASIQEQLSALRLHESGARLTSLFHEARRASERRGAYAISGAIAALVLLFALLSWIPRWGAARREAALRGEQEALKQALNEARAQSAELQRGGQEEAARLSEERLKALIAHSFEVVAIVSRQDNYIYVSPASREIYGLTEKELIGKSVYEGIHREDLIKVQDYFTLAQKELQTDQTITYRVMDAYGKWHLVESYASNQWTNPAVRGMVLNTRRLHPVESAALP